MTSKPPIPSVHRTLTAVECTFTERPGAWRESVLGISDQKRNSCNSCNIYELSAAHQRKSLDPMCATNPLSVRETDLFSHRSETRANPYVNTSPGSERVGRLEWEVGNRTGSGNATDGRRKEQLYAPPPYSHTFFVRHPSENQTAIPFELWR
ncbi:hypothetical protein ZHAS_00015628 [Anopheles sinensis]|uniref:Uncharacterized protein n=1 Tax=Anopheles sinensis TaxID=74873 RepID=A0A084WAY8_ANOSI|nr:hypothetical protein ZHAS_00015628 [Anopheles sinensis]